MEVTPLLSRDTLSLRKGLMDDVRVWLFYWLLNYWRVFRPENFDMGDMWREIMESMPDLPECALDGCDYVLFGYRPQAIFCCKEHNHKAYDKKRVRTPGYKAWQKAYQKAYKQTPEYKAQQSIYSKTPEVKARVKAYRQTPECKAYHKAYNQTPEYKAYNKARRQTPEYKAYQKAYYKAYYKANREKILANVKAYSARKKAEAKAEALS